MFKAGRGRLNAGVSPATGLRTVCAHHVHEPRQPAAHDRRPTAAVPTAAQPPRLARTHQRHVTGTAPAATTTTSYQQGTPTDSLTDSECLYESALFTKHNGSTATFSAPGALKVCASWGSKQWSGPWRARVARAYNEGLGVEPPAGSRGRAPVGVRAGGEAPPEAESFLVLERPTERQNLTRCQFLAVFNK